MGAEYVYNVWPRLHAMQLLHVNHQMATTLTGALRSRYAFFSFSAKSEACIFRVIDGNLTCTHTLIVSTTLSTNHYLPHIRPKLTTNPSNAFPITT